MNTYGKNQFREVLVRCQQCKGEQVTNMQCDTGEYEWECALCDEKTIYTVSEVDPQLNYQNSTTKAQAAQQEALEKKEA